MNKLSLDHYLPVFVKPITGRILLCNPIFIKQWQKNNSFLKRLKLKPLNTPYLNCFYFDELKTELEVDEDSNLKDSLSNFFLQSISLPEKLTEQEYYQLMEGNYLAVTEKLISRHVCGHVASSRHILLHDIQIKGVGRTASTHQLSYPNMNGFIQTGEAIRGYYNGQLLKTSLPFGSVNVQAVLCVADHKLHSSLVIRDALSHRLAQIEPAFLKEEERLSLESEVELYFPSLSKLEILDRIFEQHLCLWAMGVDHPMTSDNLALSGFPMDEEDMRPSHKMNGLSIDFIIHIDGDDKFPLNSASDLKDLNFSMYPGICHKLNHLINWYDEALSWILNEESSVTDFEKNKFNKMQNVLERFYNKLDVEKFLVIFSQLSVQGRMNKIDSLDLIDKLFQKNFQLTITDSKMQIRQTVLTAKLILGVNQDLRGKYNSLPRLETEKIIKSYGRLEMETQSFDDDSFLTNSAQTHRLVNRQAFSLAADLKLNKEDLQELLNKQVNGLEIRELILFSDLGETTYSYSDFLQNYGKTGPFIIIDIILDYEGSKFVIPTLKTPIIPI